VQRKAKTENLNVGQKLISLSTIYYKTGCVPFIGSRD